MHSAQSVFMFFVRISKTDYFPIPARTEFLKTIQVYHTLEREGLK